MAKKGVLLDALGTLVALEPPAPLLVAELSRRWQVEISVAAAEAAFAAEIGFYKAHHLEGRDEASLADLRERCAAVLHAALPDAARVRVEPDELLAAMLASLRFRAYPDVPAWLGVLRAAGLKLAVVSNWDVSLDEVLERVGIAEFLDCVVTSAAVRAAKPDPAPFERALECLGLAPGEAVHLGDSPDLDLPGAAAAGIEAVLISRRPAV
ncbi:MAG TPA: HAD-IA family hydrolase [Solirubrobacterales bacterium]|nr:HAD-IA family hydrolase [Solirubrobacterales bacterium]